MEINKAPIMPDAALADIVIGDLQRGLVKALPWLDRAFGRAERLVKYNEMRQKVFTPNVYAGGDDYLEVSPDCNVGNFCFFWLDDPQGVAWDTRTSVAITAPCSLIFWLDFREVFGERSVRNREAVKKEILEAIAGSLVRKGRFLVDSISELAENIYKEFSIDEVDNQFLMHPYGGFRFDGELQISETCI